MRKPSIRELIALRDYLAEKNYREGKASYASLERALLTAGFAKEKIAGGGERFRTEGGLLVIEPYFYDELNRLAVFVRLLYTDPQFRNQGRAANVLDVLCGEAGKRDLPVLACLWPCELNGDQIAALDQAAPEFKTRAEGIRRLLRKAGFRPSESIDYFGGIP